MCNQEMEYIDCVDLAGETKDRIIIKDRRGNKACWVIVGHECLKALAKKVLKLPEGKYTSFFEKNGHETEMQSFDVVKGKKTHCPIFKEVYNEVLEVN